MSVKLGTTICLRREKHTVVGSKKYFLYGDLFGFRALDLLPLNTPDLECVCYGRRHAKSRFAEVQIIKVPKERAAGLSAGELCRKYGNATFYK